jgi:thiol-disulfide isomerase/thioredoxin
MRRFTLLALLLAVLAAMLPLVAAENFWWEKVKAVKLNRKTYEKYVGVGKYAFLEFYSKGCTYCEQFYPQFNQLYEDFMGKNPLRSDVFIGKIDGEEESRLATDLGISIYPTFILLFPDDSSFPNKYMFERKYKVMKEYLLTLPKIATKNSAKDGDDDTEKLTQKIKEVS